MTSTPKPSTSTYKAATYAAALTWIEDSKVEYVPNPKSGKSRDRYEAYSKAATLGEALKFGSYPADLLNDYEKGLLKVSEPLRTTPLDLFSVKNFDELTYTDKILVRYTHQANTGRGASCEATEERMKLLDESLKAHKANMRRLAKIETARALNVQEVDNLADTTGNFESTLMMARRSMANEQAKAFLQQAQKEGRKVTDFEVLAALRLWDFRENVARQNVMKEGQSFVYSDTFGLVADRTGQVLAKEEARRYPEFGQLLNRWLQDTIPKSLGAEFVYTSININKNYAGKLHRDGNNVGPSFIKAFGDFTGGELNYFPEDDKSCKLEVLEAEYTPKSIAVDVSKGILLFDGKRGHWVNDFQGERYTLVFFTCPRFERITDAHMKYMTASNFPFPTQEKMDKVLTVLRKPRGYQGKGKDNLPPSIHDAAYLFYPHASRDYDKREAHAEKFWNETGMRSRLESKSGGHGRMELLHVKGKKEAGWNEHQKFELPSEPTCKSLILEYSNLNDAVSFLISPDSDLPKAVVDANCCAIFSKRQKSWYALFKQGCKEQAMAKFGLESKHAVGHGASDTSAARPVATPQKRSVAELGKVASDGAVESAQKHRRVGGEVNRAVATKTPVSKPTPDLKEGDVLTVLENFQSHNAASVALSSGQRGTVKSIDEGGDAQIHFHDHPSALQWVAQESLCKLRVLPTPVAATKKVAPASSTGKPKVAKLGKLGKAQLAKVRSKAATQPKDVKAAPQSKESRAGEKEKLSSLETYQALAACTDNARIRYKPDGKTRESHPGSYDRYAGYAKATTFEEALSLGARAADLVYDYQLGCLKIITKGKASADGSSENSRFGRLVSKWTANVEQMQSALEILES